MDCRTGLSALLKYPILFLFVLGFVAVEYLQEDPSHRGAARSAAAVMSALLADEGAGGRNHLNTVT